MPILDMVVIVTMAVWGFMTAWFLLSYMVDRADLIDIAWGLGFVWAAWLTWMLQGGGLGIKLAAAEFTTLWGLRLSLHILRRNVHKAEDHRYQEYRDKWGKHFWTFSYFRIFLVQGVLIVAISSSVMAIMLATATARSWLAVIGFVVWGLGIVLEAEADAELVKFVRRKQPGQIMTSGLWRYSRHPNYFGELTTWWGVAIVAISFGQWWGVIGAAVITLLITKISGIPLLEKHYANNKAFQRYKAHTSILIPLPPKK